MNHTELTQADVIQKAWFYAAHKHLKQMYPPGTLPYLAHVGSVCLELFPALYTAPELDAKLSLCCAILHDTLEDTDATYEDIAVEFGEAIAAGVSALSKREGLRGETATLESLSRIRQQPHEVWVVKLADRVANLGTPPVSWSLEKCRGYATEGEHILRELGSASIVLAKRLAQRITVWKRL